MNRLVSTIVYYVQYLNNCFSYIVPYCLVVISTHSFFHSLALLGTTPMYRHKLCCSWSNKVSDPTWLKMEEYYTIPENSWSNSFNFLNCTVLARWREKIQFATSFLIIKWLKLIIGIIIWKEKLCFQKSALATLILAFLEDLVLRFDQKQAK